LANDSADPCGCDQSSSVMEEMAAGGDDNG